jgi:O-Antigen ligase
VTATVHQRVATWTWPPIRTSRLVVIALLMTGVPFGVNIAGRNLPMYDLALVLVAVTAALIGAAQFVKAGGTRFPSLFPGAVACVATLALTSVVNPSTRSVENFFTVIGAGVLASQVSIAVAQDKANVLIRASFAFVFVQFIIGIAQVVNDGPIGGPWLGETSGGFRPIAGVMAPAGSLIHANALGSVMAIMTILFLGLQSLPALPQLESLLCLGGASMSAVLAVLSLARSSILAVVVAIVVAAVSTHRRRLAPTIASIMIFSATSALLRSDGWIERGKSSVGSVEAAGSGRIALARQAIAIFKLEPIFGVGPGNYIPVIRQNTAIANLSTESVPVHNVWLFVLATTGVIGVCALTWLCVDILRRTSRGGFWTIGLILALVPPLLLDAAPFMGCGLAWTAATIGVILGLSKNSRDEQLLCAGSSSQTASSE